MTQDIPYRPLAVVPAAFSIGGALLTPIPGSSTGDGGEFRLRFHSAARALLRSVADELHMPIGTFTIHTVPMPLIDVPDLDTTWWVSVLCIEGGGTLHVVGVKQPTTELPTSTAVMWTIPRVTRP